MAAINSFLDLFCWQIARQVNLELFEIIQNSPQFKLNFGLKDQILRSSGFIMDNIAEGFGRGGNNEFILFLGYANGSCCEVQSQLIRAEDFGYISSEIRLSLNQKVNSIGSMITNLRRHIQSSSLKGVKYNKGEK